MAVARIKRAAGRRRQARGFLQVASFVVLAVVGGTALWTSMQYSEAHAAARANASKETRKYEAGVVTDKQQPEGQAAGGGKGDKSANLAAWMELTTLPGADGAAGSGGSGSSGNDAANTEQQQAEKPAETAAEQAAEKEAVAQQGVGGSGGSGTTTAQAASAGGYVTVDLRVLKAPATYNSWVLSEDMLLFNRRALQQQLEQMYVALGVAAAAGRTFILPELSCFCQNSDAALPRCRHPDSSALQFPAPCPLEEVLQPLDKFGSPADKAAGMPLTLLPHESLRSLELDESKVLVVKPSATILWPACTEPHPDPNVKLACTEESVLPGGATQLILPPSLNDTHLLPLLEPYQAKFPLWRIDLSDIGSHWHAFQGWDCAEPAHQYDLRMRGAALPWPASSGGGMQPLNMTSGRIYSDEPDMKECGSGGKVAALRRLQAGGGMTAGGAEMAA